MYQNVRENASLRLLYNDAVSDSIYLSVLCLTISSLITELFFLASMEESFLYSGILLHVENH